jgi:two-component system OmpR family sensor kinase
MTAEISESIPLCRTPTDLQALLSSTMEVLGRQAREIDVDLRIEAAADVPRDALIDGEKIAWAVTTLVGNGLRYVRHGTRRMPGGSIVVRIKLESTANVLLVSVEDDGPGIAPEKLPMLFKRERGGAHNAGLALMLIRDVVEAHGGTIDVKSSATGADHGTAIIIRLPLR